MRHIKTLGVAMIAVFALVAFAGASTASADVLCNVNTNPCPTGNIVASGTTISARLRTGSSAVLQTSGGFINPTLSCAASSVTLRTTSAGGTGRPVTGNLTGLTFSSCTSTNPSGCSASATVTGLPTSGSLTWTSGGNGTLSVTAPTVTFTCPNPLGGTITCSYGTGTVSGSFTGNTPATVSFNGVPIRSLSGGLCPPTTRWTATYQVDSPASLYLFGP